MYVYGGFAVIVYQITGSQSLVENPILTESGLDILTESDDTLITET